MKRGFSQFVAPSSLVLLVFCLGSSFPPTANKVRSMFRFVVRRRFVFLVEKENKVFLNFLLSVSVGSQLADVFLHLLTESYSSKTNSSIDIGRWTIAGLMVFFFIEQIFPDDDDDQSTKIKVHFVSPRNNSSIFVTRFRRRVT